MRRSGALLLVPMATSWSLDLMTVLFDGGIVLRSHFSLRLVACNVSFAGFQLCPLWALLGDTLILGAFCKR